MTVPVKGLVFRHPKRKTWNGEPMECTVTSVTPELVYFRLQYGERIKSRRESWERAVTEDRVVSTPDATVSDRGPKLSTSECADLHARAHAAGYAAGSDFTPTPMHVVEHSNPLDDSSPVKRDYGLYADGVCGFAWVNVRPGNSSFARWLTKTNIGRAAYEGGVQLWISHFGQSMERKSAYARAYAQVLTDAGIRAYAESRMD